MLGAAREQEAELAQISVKMRTAQPLRSMEIQLNYFLWRALKEKCYVDKPETIEPLEANIPDGF